MDKTIVVGVGGTGLNAIRSVRRRIVETHSTLAAFPQLGFLYLDTDDAEVVITEDNRKRWEVMGVSTALSQAEYRIIEAPGDRADHPQHPGISPDCGMVPG